MPLTDAEKVAVRYHLGYPSLFAAASANLGIPGVNQLNFLVEQTFSLVRPSSEDRIRRAIQELDCIEDQLSSDRRVQKLTKAGNTSFRGADGMAELETQYLHWANSLADTMGVQINPFSLKFQRMTGQMPHLRPESGVVEIWE